MESEILSKLQEYEVGQAYVLAYFYNMMCVGIYKDGEIIFNKKVNYDLLTQIRIFNKKLEVRFALNEDTEKFEMVIIDDNIPNVGRFDEAMFIAGNKIVDINNNFTVIKQTGGNIDIPFKVEENDLRNGLRLIVRNYFNTDKNNQVIIENSRLVDIRKEEGDFNVE